MMVNSILTKPVADILASIGNLRCESEGGTTFENCNLCAMRIYTYINNGSEATVTIRNCLWFTNTFRPYIQSRNCADFPETTDIGVSKCDPMPYEDVEEVTLCICATNECTTDLDTCRQSVEQQEGIIKLDAIMKDLTEIIQCADLSNQATTCFTGEIYSPKNQEACTEYVTNNAVFCTLLNQNTENLQKSALIYEDYQSYLTERLVALMQIIALATVQYQDKAIYANYPVSGEATQTQCGCAFTSSCNSNLNTCFSSVAGTEASTVNSIDTTDSVTSTSLSASTADTNEELSSSLITSDTLSSSLSTSATVSQDSLPTNTDTSVDSSSFTNNDASTSILSIDTTASQDSLPTNTDTSVDSSSFTNNDASTSILSIDTTASQDSLPTNTDTSVDSSSFMNNDASTNILSIDTTASQDSLSTNTDTSVDSSSFTNSDTSVDISSTVTDASEDSSSENSNTATSSLSINIVTSEDSSSSSSLSTNTGTSDESLSTAVEISQSSSISSINTVQSSLSSDSSPETTQSTSQSNLIPITITSK